MIEENSHFAQTEINALVSLFIQGFEIENAGSEEGSGVYTMPPFRKSGMHVGGLKPAQDVQVRLRRREGLDDVEWQFEM